MCPGGFESLPALILYGEISAWYRGLLLTNNVTAYSLRGKMVIYNGEWSLYLRQQWKHLESVWTHTFCYQNHHVIISSYERRGRRKNEDNRNTASHCAYCVPHHFGFIRLTFLYSGDFFTWLYRLWPYCLTKTSNCSIWLVPICTINEDYVPFLSEFWLLSLSLSWLFLDGNFILFICIMFQRTN